MDKAKRNRDDYKTIYVDDDPIFGSYIPEFYKSDASRMNNDLHPELRKMMYSTLPEGQDNRFSLENEEDGLYFEQYRNMAINYYNAKKAFFDDAFENQLNLTTKEFLERSEQIKLDDSRMEAKLDYMYNYLDYDNDRSKVRSKFLFEMNKRATLEDIGETLDEMVIDSKAKNWKHYNLAEHYGVHSKRASQDYTSEDFKWSGRLLK